VSTTHQKVSNQERKRLVANLTPKDKELLAVVKYYNDNVSKIDRLVVKLVDGLGVESAAILTGYTESTVAVICDDYAAEKAKRQPKKVAKAVEGAEVTERLAIHLNAESGSIQRIAYDISKAIERELQSGEMLWPNREMAERFGRPAGNSWAKVHEILISHNWTKPVNESNRRYGYIVI
jgi:hypothetical protein